MKITRKQQLITFANKLLPSDWKFIPVDWIVKDGEDCNGICKFNTKEVKVVFKNRTIYDIQRTIIHEYVHVKLGVNEKPSHSKNFYTLLNALYIAYDLAYQNCRSRSCVRL